MKRTVRFQAVADLAYLHQTNGLHMTGPELASYLNWAGHRTDGGQFYLGMRGIYRLVSMTCKWLHDQGRLADEDRVAQTFVTPDGRHAWA
jgi:hypothetical protein